MPAPRARDEARPCPGSGLMTMSKLRSAKILARRLVAGGDDGDAMGEGHFRKRVGDVGGEGFAVEQVQQLVAAEARRGAGGEDDGGDAVRRDQARCGRLRFRRAPRAPACRDRGRGR